MSMNGHVDFVYFVCD